MFNDIIVTTFIFLSIYAIAAMSGYFAERSGTINLSINGGMLIGAMSYIIMMYTLTNDEADFSDKIPMTIGMILTSTLIAILSGIAITTLLSIGAINLNGDQVVIGTAINILAPALSFVLLWWITGKDNIPTGNLQYLSSGLAFEIGWDAEVVTGSLAFITMSIIGLLWFVMNKTKFGLRLRAAGENPNALAAAGISVQRTRHYGMLISGGLAGFAGAITAAFAPSLSTFRHNVSGMGFIAIAVLIIGQWRAHWIILGAIMFSFISAVSNAYSVEFGEKRYLLQMIPYISTILILPIVSRYARAPKSAGVPYNKSKR